MKSGFCDCLLICVACATSGSCRPRSQLEASVFVVGCRASVEIGRQILPHAGIRSRKGQDHGVKSLRDDAAGLEAAGQPGLAFAERDGR
jgi:hypothetical protein